MNNFKDFVLSDRDVFFNFNEFASEVEINGKMIKVVIDNDLLQKYNLKNGGEGLSQGELLFHANVHDFEEKPYIDSHIRFNSKLYRISDVQENEGIYTVTLKGFSS